MKLNATMLAECPYLPPDRAAAISPYGYVPTASICILFLVCFSISTAVHLGEAVRWRTWWLLPTAVLCGIGEIAGWGGRLWSTHNVCSDGYMMQIISLIISPTPLIAANFIILGRLIAKVGPKYSRLNPRLYARVFLSCDLVALVIQAAGGAIAATSNTPSGANLGGNIMLGGIVFQLISITVFAGLASEFFWRRFKRAPFPGRAAALKPSGPNDVEMKGQHARSDSRATLLFVHDGDTSAGLALYTRLALFGLVTSTVLLYIRSIYRTAELSDGWHGTIIRTETYFNVFDGMMILFAMICLNVLHPGYLLAEMHN